MAEQKRPSGGVRDAARRFAEMDEKRPDGYTEREAASFESLVRSMAKVDDLGFASAVLRWAIERAGRDPGIAPQVRRAHVAQYAASLGKLADPKRIIAELTAELRKAYAVLTEVSTERAPQPTRADRRGETDHRDETVC